MIGNLGSHCIPKDLSVPALAPTAPLLDVGFSFFDLTTSFAIVTAKEKSPWTTFSTLDRVPTLTSCWRALFVQVSASSRVMPESSRSSRLRFSAISLSMATSALLLLVPAPPSTAEVSEGGGHPQLVAHLMRGAIGRRLGEAESLEDLLKHVAHWKYWGEDELRRVQASAVFCLPVARGELDLGLAVVCDEGEAGTLAEASRLRVMIVDRRIYWYFYDYMP